MLIVLELKDEFRLWWRDTEMALQKGQAQVSVLILLTEDSSVYKHTTSCSFLCRYFLDDDDDSPLQGFLEERETKSDNKSQSSDSSETNTLWLPDVVKDFVFPTGFPGTCQLQISYVPSFVRNLRILSL